MKAVGLYRSLPIDAADSLVELDLPEPMPGAQDLLVRVLAASVNPVDTKQRARMALDAALEKPLVLGFDACGDVIACGRAVTGFKPGDRVFYAGDINRPGSNAERQLVDHRIVAHAPKSLSPEQAAALPLTALTAWEALFERMALPRTENVKTENAKAKHTKTSNGRTLLVIGGAGGVGSITLQIARALSDFRLVATASRPESIAFAHSMGAEVVVDHRDLVGSMRAAGIDQVDAIFNTADLNEHWNAITTLIAPGGVIGAIVGAKKPVDLGVLQRKSVRFAWEFMFTRSSFGMDDMAVQGEILASIAGMADHGTLRSTMTECLHGLSAATLKQAHAMIESGRTIGKIAIRY